jgi:hypothetical protein
MIIGLMGRTSWKSSQRSASSGQTTTAVREGVVDR